MIYILYAIFTFTRMTPYADLNTWEGRVEVKSYSTCLFARNLTEKIVADSISWNDGVSTSITCEYRRSE